MIQKVKQTSEHKYEVLDYITVSGRQYFDTDVHAKSGVGVIMTCTLSSSADPWTRFFSSHDAVDYSGQNWAFASGCWGLQFENSQLCIKALGASNNNTSSFGFTNKYKSDLQNIKYKYDLSCDGILNIYDANDTLWYTYDCSSITVSSKVSSTTIRMFARETSVSNEYLKGNIYDIIIYDGNNTVHHYVPVKRLSDNAKGFYDDITQTFISSAQSPFTGTSKSVPEYIDETTEQTVYVKDIMLNGSSINRIYNDGSIYWGNAPSFIPTYEVLDYIENTLSSNTDMSYINTGFRPTYNTRLEFKFFYPADRVIKEIYGGVLSFGCVAWDSSNRTNADLSFTNIYWLTSGYGSGQTWICGSRIGNNASNYYPWAQYYRFIQDGQDHMLEGTISTSSFNMNVDGTDYSLTPISSGWTGIDGTSNTVSELYLFTGIWANIQSDPIPPSTAVSSRCYYFKIYDNDVLVRNFIPVKRLSDNEIGMYDTVNEIFYGSESQMKFIGTSKSVPEYI